MIDMLHVLRALDTMLSVGGWLLCILAALLLWSALDTWTHFRARREIIRILSEQTLPMRGLAIVQASDGKLWRSRIYVHLSLMEDAKLIISYADARDVYRLTNAEFVVTRRVYALTAFGKQLQENSIATEAVTAAKL